MLCFWKTPIEYFPLYNCLVSYITALLLSFTDDQKPFFIVIFKQIMQKFSLMLQNLHCHHYNLASPSSSSSIR